MSLSTPMPAFPAMPAPNALVVPAQPMGATPLSVGLSARFLQTEAVELARMIAAGIDDGVQLAADKGLKPDQWLVLEGSPHFQRLLTEARTELSSAAGLADKVRLKALTALDYGGIAQIAAVMFDGNARDADKLAAANTLKEIGGLTKQKDTQASQVGGGPLINIVFGPGSAPVTIGTGTVIDS